MLVCLMLGIMVVKAVRIFQICHPSCGYFSCVASSSMLVCLMLGILVVKAVRIFEIFDARNIGRESCQNI